MLLVKNSEKFSHLALVFFEIRPFLWPGQGGPKSAFSKFWEEECEMVREFKCKVQRDIEVRKCAKFEKDITSTLGVKKKSLAEKLGFKANIKVL